MAISIAPNESMADRLEEDRNRFLRYGAVLLLSVALHGVLWQLRGALDRRAEPRPKPVRIIEVSLVAAPKAAAKTPEPAPQRKEMPRPDPKPVIVPSKPVIAPKRAETPRPKPILKPQQVPKPIPRSKPVPPPPAVEESSTPLPVMAPPKPVAGSGEARPAAPANRLEGSPVRNQAEESARADYLHSPKPVYPAVARHRHWEGRVVLKVRVLVDGTCGQVEVHQSSGHEVLDEAALEAVGSWRFSPAKRGGKPVESWVNVPISFNLQG